MAPHSTGASAHYDHSHTPHIKEKDSAKQELKPRLILYFSTIISLMQGFQYGWSVSQINYTPYHDEATCAAKPVVPGTCVLFPGHTQLHWTLMVNAWVLGGMFGSLGSSYPADKLGRRRMLQMNAVVMMIGSVLQAIAQNVWLFAAGRFIAGIASGAGTAVLGSYLSEISPPHLRGALSSCIQVSIVTGIFIVSCTFYFAGTELGWRINAGIPTIIGALNFLVAPIYMVESPSWLLANGHVEKAHNELGRLFGRENIKTALKWIEKKDQDLESDNDLVQYDENGQITRRSCKSTRPYDTTKVEMSLIDVFRFYWPQLIVALGCSAAQQLSGINAVFFYSSDIFKRAGLKDVRVGNLIVDTVNALPTFMTGYLLSKFKKRVLLLCGIFCMFLSAIGMTVALLINVSMLTIVFTALYVTAFSCSLGPLVWGITAEVFPDHVRANAQSICLVVNWACNLCVGIAYPFIAAALKDYGFVPFVGTLGFFGVFIYYTLPETSGKTIDEIQAEFSKVK
ncbi:hypothetical protein ABG067_004737 [Albugo candida]|uniref:Hexose transporter 1 n=1 Tax=Albugo candida TaxID=65357 RepID=A0A024GEJ7_9STRA|nr:unnamed protein product [Albugo candida]|eukprot:CCI44910.1 unnamed protein product [Albugo candida]